MPGTPDKPEARILTKRINIIPCRSCIHSLIEKLQMLQSLQHHNIKKEKEETPKDLSEVQRNKDLLVIR